MKKIILYRFGIPNGDRSKWFGRVDEAVLFGMEIDGKSPGERDYKGIYFISLPRPDFGEMFESQGNGFGLRDEYKQGADWIFYKSRKTPSCLLNRLELV